MTSRHQMWVTASAGLILGLVLAGLTAGAEVADLSQALPGFENDDSRNAVYLHHQVHDALRTGRFDLSDPDQLFPAGTPLLQLHGGNILEFVVSGITRALLPWPTWLSVAAMAWIPLNLLAFLPLGLRLWKRPGAALAGAAAWTMSPVLALVRRATDPGRPHRTSHRSARAPRCRRTWRTSVMVAGRGRNADRTGVPVLRVVPAVRRLVFATTRSASAGSAPLRWTSSRRPQPRSCWCHRGCSHWPGLG